VALWRLILHVYCGHGVQSQLFIISLMRECHSGGRSWRAKLTQTITILIKPHHNLCHKASWHLSSNERARGMHIYLYALVNRQSGVQLEQLNQRISATEHSERVQSQRVRSAGNKNQHPFGVGGYDTRAPLVSPEGKGLLDQVLKCQCGYIKAFTFRECALHLFLGNNPVQGLWTLRDLHWVEFTF
jgi:hypothetical protein